MTISPATRAELPRIRRLYESAFPREERKPFSLILRKRRQGAAEILAIDENGFKGFAVTLLHGDIALIDYFAMDPAARGQGLGSRAIALLCERYAGNRVLLEIEAPDEAAENREQRVRRKAFYLRNGFAPAGVSVNIYGTDMELLVRGETVSFDEYTGVLRGTLGGIIMALLRVRRIS